MRRQKAPSARILTRICTLAVTALALSVFSTVEAQARPALAPETRDLGPSSTHALSRSTRKTAPGIRLAFTSVPEANTSSSSATIAWTVQGTGHVWCSLDEGTAGSCSSPTSYAGVSAGAHSFVVTAWNAKSKVTVKTSWTVVAAATAPTAPPTPTPAPTPPPRPQRHRRPRPRPQRHRRRPQRRLLLPRRRPRLRPRLRLRRRRRRRLLRPRRRVRCVRLVRVRSRV